MPHLSDIYSECPLCGGRELFTGRARERDGRVGAVLRCRDCRGEGFTWSQRFEPALEAYLTAREALRDPEKYDLAWEALRTPDPDHVTSILQLLQEERIVEAPFFRLEHVHLPDTVSAAQLWTELALTYPGFRPVPSSVERLEEALATAIHFDVAACAEAAAHYLSLLDPTTLASLLQRLPVRMGGARSGEALIPFFRAVSATDDRSDDTLQEARLRWSVPALRKAARRGRTNSP